MSKTYLIETRQTHIIGYFVQMDDDADPKEIAGKIIEDAPWSLAIAEIYQYDAGEVFEQCIPSSMEQAPRIFRAKNEYLASLEDDEIRARFTMDMRTKKEKE